jgi:hypothetical protein
MLFILAGILSFTAGALKNHTCVEEATFLTPLACLFFPLPLALGSVSFLLMIFYGYKYFRQKEKVSYEKLPSHLLITSFMLSFSLIGYYLLSLNKPLLSYTITTYYFSLEINSLIIALFLFLSLLIHILCLPLPQFSFPYNILINSFIGGYSGLFHLNSWNQISEKEKTLILSISYGMRSFFLMVLFQDLMIKTYHPFLLIIFLGSFFSGNYWGHCKLHSIHFSIAHKILCFLLFFLILFLMVGIL